MNFEIVKSIVLLFCFMYILIDLIFKIPDMKKFFSDKSDPTDKDKVLKELKMLRQDERIKEVYGEGNLILASDLDDEGVLVLDIKDDSVVSFKAITDELEQVKIISKYVTCNYSDFTYEDFKTFLCSNYFGGDDEEMIEFTNAKFWFALQNRAGDKFKGGLAQYKNVNVA